MLENLFNLVKEFSGDAVVNNPDVPNEQNDAVTAEATKTVAGGLQNMLAGGGLESVMSLFNNGQQQGNGGVLKNPIVTMMIGHFASKLMTKFGLGSAQASNVASNLIPNVISNMVTRTNDPNNSSFDINSIIGSLTGGGGAAQQQTGGGGFDIQSILNNFNSGGGASNGLSDIISSITGGAQQQQQQQGGGGGLMDMIKGFMK